MTVGAYFTRSIAQDLKPVARMHRAVVQTAQAHETVIRVEYVPAVWRTFHESTEGTAWRICRRSVLAHGGEREAHRACSIADRVMPRSKVSDRRDDNLAAPESTLILGSMSQLLVHTQRDQTGFSASIIDQIKEFNGPWLDHFLCGNLRLRSAWLECQEKSQDQGGECKGFRVERHPLAV